MSTSSTKVFDTREKAEDRLNDLKGWDNAEIVEVNLPDPDGGYKIRAKDPYDNQVKTLRQSGQFH